MWDGGRRYYARFEYDQKQFHCRVMKAVVDGGFSCPNLDGTKGTGGCIFCDGGSGYFTHSGSIAEQLQTERARIHAKFPAAKLIAYFQAHTNTYAPLAILKERYETALQQPDVACQAKRKKVTRKTQKTALIHPIYGNQSGFSYVI